MRAATLALALLIPASPVLAQTGQNGGSVLWLVPSAGTLEPENALNGTLSSSDFYGPDDVYIDVWEIEGTAGGSVTFDLMSEDFDAVLFVVGPGLAETLYDDDSGGRCNSRLTVRFLESGTYRVAATTTFPRTTGVYTLSVAADPQPAPAIPCGGPDPASFQGLTVTGRVEAGADPISGTLNPGDVVLENGSLADVYEISAQEGETVTIRLQSEDLDSFLYLTGTDLGGVITDDDGGGDLHARIVFTFPASGTYRIIASTVSSGATGAYTLTVTR